MLLLALGWFLRVRGWSVEHFAAYPSGRELAMAHRPGGCEAPPVWALPWLLFAPADTAGPAAAGARPELARHPGRVSIINPLFEELFLCAYMLPFLAKRRGPVVAVAASLLVRLSFHTYQGPVGLLSIGLVGLVFTIFYCARRAVAGAYRPRSAGLPRSREWLTAGIVRAQAAATRPPTALEVGV